MTIDLCVFDVAGTTIEDDGCVSRSLARALVDLGVHAGQDELRVLAGLPRKFVLEEVLRRRGARVSHQALHAACVAFDQSMVEHFTAHGAALVDGARDAFSVLRARGVGIALTTSFPHRVLQVLLFRAGLRPGREIDVAVASDECPRGRPWPDAIEHAMRRLGVEDARRVCKVGDAIADMREGRAARVGLVVGVASGSATRVELERAGATLVLPSVAALPLVLFGGPRHVTCAGEASPMLPNRTGLPSKWTAESRDVSGAA